MSPTPGGEGERFNLSALALRFPQLTLFVLVLVAAAGAWSYLQIGQREDPDFTFRAMVVRTIWPGATTSQVDEVVTNRIEKTLQEVPYFRHTTSYSRPGESLIILELEESSPPGEVEAIWYQVRKKVGDIRPMLPDEVIGPFFNDEFGDVFGTIYAITGDGFDLEELRRVAESVRQELLRVPDVQKIELFGIQDQRIYIEVSSRQLATLGIGAQQIAEQLQAQNVVAPGGIVSGETHSVPLRVTGQFDSVAEIESLNLDVGGRLIRLGDIARVVRGYVDPPVWTMRFDGRQAIGLGVSMVSDGDVIKLGENLAAAMARIEADLPLGISFTKVSDQPRIVHGAVGLFMKVLAEALAIVLAVSFLSLGLRVGSVVALSIPLVLAGTFVLMSYFGIDLHRISTGALIIALGLLVDDAMIAIEMMARKMDEGLDRFRAATHAYRTTAFPMLTGTLVTAAGFLPIATAKSATGEYTFGIFAVVTMALLVSWLVAVGATPFIGYYVLGRGKEEPHEVFDTPFYRRLRRLIDACMRHRWLTLALTVLAFAGGVAGMGLTEKQFFPDSDRSEILVELWLPEGSSHAATETQAKRLEALLDADEDVLTYVGYVGNGSPRYFLSLNQELFRPNYAQYVILTRDVAGRDRATERLREILDRDFPGVRARAFRPPLGPPVAYPIQFRVMGDDVGTLKRIAAGVVGAIRDHPAVIDPHELWGQQAPALRITVDQARARRLGLSSGQIARAVGTVVSGATIGRYREDDQLIEVVLRAPAGERTSVESLGGLQVPTALGTTVALSQVATIETVMEEPIIWRRSRTPVIMVRAELADGAQAPHVAGQLDPLLDPLRADLPPGYRIEVAGPAEDNALAQESIAAGMPMMLGIVALLLMLQLRRFSLAAMVLLTAPLGIIGVAAALLVFDKPFGFVAMLGTIALGGMIMRNTVILVDQIRQDIEHGVELWVAVRESAVRRFRPIALTAAAAVLAMIPLSRDVLWGPMAFSIMGGLIVATVLTVLFVPALYVAWYRIRPQPEPPAPAGD
ncbi:MAG: efflux RND transporter permease subunit [Burkholderiaceae bacterium]|nr:efflux RND transporter permease subunit [Burkholderiaceae bacterium]MEB2319802.1 efflux RND transporter permease subunit [Pseudomonadota bacterium]